MELKELEEKYELEFDSIVENVNSIKKKNPKVLLQFPDGLKQYSTEIVKYLEEKTDANYVIWLGSCFGACDIPQTDADLIIQFGHAPWKFKE